LLDCCRSNAHHFSLSRDVNSGGMKKVVDSPQGTMVMFSCAANKTASDGKAGQMGLLAQAWLEHGATPGLTLDNLGIRITNSVTAFSGGKQTPFRTSNITTEDACLVVRLYCVCGFAAWRGVWPRNGVWPREAPSSPRDQNRLFSPPPSSLR
jgi:hypothetical protein